MSQNLKTVTTVVTKKLEMWQNSKWKEKNQNMIKLKMWQKTKTQNMTKLKKLKIGCDKTKKKNWKSDKT